MDVSGTRAVEPGTVSTVSMDVDWQGGTPNSDLGDELAARLGAECLRWCVTAASADRLTVELSCWDGPLDAWRGGPEAAPSPSAGRAVVVSVVPTGIGCEVGGYAGDAGPATALLAACCDAVVTNPNAVNGSDFASLPGNVLYAEGSIV